MSVSFTVECETCEGTRGPSIDTKAKGSPGELGRCYVIDPDAMWSFLRDHQYHHLRLRTT